MVAFPVIVALQISRRISLSRSDSKIFPCEKNRGDDRGKLIVNFHSKFSRETRSSLLRPRGRAPAHSENQRIACKSPRDVGVGLLPDFAIQKESRSPESDHHHNITWVAIGRYSEPQTQEDGVMASAARKGGSAAPRSRPPSRDDGAGYIGKLPKDEVFEIVAQVLKHVQVRVSFDVPWRVTKPRSTSDPLNRFLAECVEKSIGDRVQSSLLHRIYEAWSGSKGAERWSNRRLSQAMEERGYRLRKSNQCWWLDIKLIRSADDLLDKNSEPISHSESNRFTEPILPSSQKREDRRSRKSLKYRRLGA